MVETKHFSVYELKAASDDSGAFTGILSTYGNVDHVGDVCEKGCFDKSVAERSDRTLLWNHDTNQPIGSFTVVDTEKALEVAGSFNMDVAKAKEVYSLLKRGDVSGMSIGYIVERATFDDKGIRHLTEVNLLEGSIVVIPANDKAKASVKSLQSSLPKDVRARLAKSRELKTALSEEDLQTVLSAVDSALEEALGNLEEAPEDEKGKKEDEEVAEEEELKQLFERGTKAIKDMRKELKA